MEVPATGLHRIPDGLDWADAALTEPLGCVINNIDKINIKPREWVVISGPGPMGLLTLQVARAANARVIVVGINQDALRLEAAKELGAEVVFNIEALGYQTVVHLENHVINEGIIVRTSDFRTGNRLVHALLIQYSSYTFSQ
ncbi:MAG TPA: zinc-binding dehydrogenase [Paenibacillus sp.]|uniref:zinc-binding dehydrogenase n=1 Tax=Paenibacillus sp. TaxID=58172 RepID=UPI002C4A7751|nr:zinc-binding dehydrogenase [Paenibacillus sp.]HUC94256.1 zinc-binding dehydrogenase [Paenibacillus sp.]